MLAHLLEGLPLHAEEGNEREVVDESNLKIICSNDGDQSSAEGVLITIKALFESLALLDQKMLGSGKWAFVSFPASLLGRSIVATLSTSGQRLFPDHFWEQGAHRPTHEIELQRVILSEIESRRVKFHPDKAAKSIRTVHVAWGMIKIQGRFLLLHREDQHRQNVKNYVFPGGRLNASDIPESGRDELLLRNLFDAKSQLARTALPRTLARELEEECGLSEDDYKCGTTAYLPSFRKVEGSGNRHAFTEYAISCFPINLSVEGELKLLQAEVREKGQFAWFTDKELLGEIRSDGKRAFVDALTTNDSFDPKVWLQDIAESGTICWKYANDTDSLELPVSAGRSFRFGKSGKESNIEVSLTMDEWGLLMLMGWHAKGMNVSALENHLDVLGNGWLRLRSTTALEAFTGLLQKMSQARLPSPQLQDGNFCRLSLDPQFLFFARELFTYQLPDADRDSRITFSVSMVETAWGQLSRATVDLDISRNMVRAIRSIELGGEANESHIKTEDLDRQAREAFKPTRAIGLRKFIFTSNKRRLLAVSGNS